MKAELKKRILKLRERGIRYKKIIDTLAKEGVSLDYRQVKSYILSRTTEHELLPEEQYTILHTNSKDVIKLIKMSTSVDSAYEDIGNTQYGYRITYCGFINWIGNIGGYKKIKNSTYKSREVTKPPVISSKNGIGTLDTHRELIISNIEKSYQSICDLIQERDGYIIDPRSLSLWCKNNSISKTRPRRNNSSVTKNL